MARASITPRTGMRSRVGLVVAAAGLFLTAGAAVMPTAASAAVVDPNASYVLLNRNSGKALDVYNFSTADGARVVQWPDLGGVNQQWQLVRLAAGTFSNPVKRNGPDPWMQYHDGFYYLATTTWNSTITMRRSRTLAGLPSAPDTVVFTLSGMPNGCCNMWAPEFHLINGRWYLYYVSRSSSVTTPTASSRRGTTGSSSRRTVPRTGSSITPTIPRAAGAI
jgi:hypothetical protein